jgi:arylsulfatase
MTNIAMVVLDTLRKDRFDDFFEWLPGIRFESAFSTANWTVPAHASMFTGKYSSEVGLHAKSRSIKRTDQTLPQRLSADGYKVRGYSCNHNISIRNNWDNCFDQFRGPLDLWYPSYTNNFNWNKFLRDTDKDGINKYINGIWKCIRGDYDTFSSLIQGFYMQRGRLYKDTEVNDKGSRSVLNELRDSSFGEDEFIFINLMEAHTPYYPPKEYRVVDEDITVTVAHSLGLDDPPENVEKAYDSSVKYLSDIYKKIFEVLQEDFDYIFTLSDHGEMLGEDGIWNHTYGVYPELTNIPLVVSGQDDSQYIDETVSLLDVHKTIADLAEINVDSRGQNLLTNPSSNTVLTEYKGLIPFAVDQLQQRQIDDDVIDRYESELFGVAFDNGSYSFETLDGVVTDSDKNRVNEEIESIQNGFEYHDYGTSSVQKSRNVEEHLKDLGYA